jgi:hypothetical protein
MYYIVIKESIEQEEMHDKVDASTLPTLITGTDYTMEAYKIWYTDTRTHAGRRLTGTR